VLALIRRVYSADTFRGKNSQKLGVTEELFIKIYGVRLVVNYNTFPQLGISWFDGVNGQPNPGHNKNVKHKPDDDEF